MKLKTLINNNKTQFDRQFKKLLNNTLDNSILSKAMYYGSINGGKRIRPFLVNQASKQVKISKYDAFIIASSIECIHSYSLIHDDLPSMDNDDYRRGKLSTHKKFNEATAILAGDALHDLSFELLSGKLKNKNNLTKIKLINYLSNCLGYNGLAAGQSLDLLFENKNLNQSKILNMYQKKTGRLFEFSFTAPFILADCSNAKIKFAKDFGLLFGLVFQIIDDVLDENSTLEKLGKTPGKDIKHGKSTILKIVGRDNALKICESKIDQFLKKYSRYIKENITLKEILYYGLKRIM
mgnify:CR=1 FL=1